VGSGPAWGGRWGPPPARVCAAIKRCSCVVVSCGWVLCLGLGDWWGGVRRGWGEKACWRRGLQRRSTAVLRSLPLVAAPGACCGYCLADCDDLCRCSCR
jgi:hypothetical protein